MGILTALAVGTLWTWGASPEELGEPHFFLAVSITLCANMLELLSEPGYARAQRQMSFKRRFIVESTAVLALCLTLFFWVFSFGPSLLGWAAGQVAFSLACAIGYTTVPNIEKSSSSSSSSWFFSLPSQSTFHLWLSQQWQCGQALALQEGERIMLKVLAPLSQQGSYGLVAALGSLVVRSVFFPLEEVASLYFSRLLSTTTTTTTSSSSSGSNVVDTTTTTTSSSSSSSSSLSSSSLSSSSSPSSLSLSSSLSSSSLSSSSSTFSSQPHDDHDRQVEAIHVLQMLLRLLTSIAAVAIFFSSPLSSSCLRLLYNNNNLYLDTPFLLSHYAHLVALLAINGTLETFVRASISPQQQHALNVIFFFLSVLHVATGTLLLRNFGPVGLIWSSCLQTTLRIAYSVWYVRNFWLKIPLKKKSTTSSSSSSLSSSSWFKVAPPVSFVAILAVSNLVLNLAKPEAKKNGVSFIAAMGHVGSGGLLFCLACLSVYITDRPWIVQLKSLWTAKQKKN